MCLSLREIALMPARLSAVALRLLPTTLGFQPPIIRPYICEQAKPAIRFEQRGDFETSACFQRFKKLRQLCRQRRNELQWFARLWMPKA